MKKLIFIILFSLFTVNAYSNTVNEYEESCLEKRLINLESRFIGDFRVDNQTIDSNCDFNQIQIFENNEHIFTKIIGQGYNTISQYLDGQAKISESYIWLEFFPGSKNWYTYGYYFGNGKVESIDNTNLRNCKFLEENKLLCRTTTKRKFNLQNTKCTFEFIPDDIYELVFTGIDFHKNIIEEEPITDECS